jgi:NADPH:quinone reductase
MRSVVLTGKGTFDFAEVAKPTPAEDQVLVKVDCAVINPSDVLFITGKTGAKVDYPFTPGWEGAGTIEAVGAKLEGLGLEGKRVGFSRQTDPTYKIGGAMAEYCVTDMKSIIPLRDETTHEQGVALFVNPLTALSMIHRVKELGSKCVIITAAASQLGRMLITLAHKEGLTPICTVRRAEQAELLEKEYGAKFVVNTSTEDYK